MSIMKFSEIRSNFLFFFISNASDHKLSTLNFIPPTNPFWVTEKNSLSSALVWSQGTSLCLLTVWMMAILSVWRAYLIPDQSNYLNKNHPFIMEMNLPIQFLGPCPKPTNPNLLRPSDSLKLSGSNLSGLGKQSSSLQRNWSWSMRSCQRKDQRTYLGMTVTLRSFGMMKSESGTL